MIKEKAAFFMSALVPVAGIWHNDGRFEVKEPALKPLFTLFWQICRFRSGPEDVPYAPALLGLMLVLVLTLGLSSIPLLSAYDDPAKAVPAAQQVIALLFSVSSWMVILYALLRFMNHGARYVQTMTAALGTDLIFGVPQVVLYWLLLSSPAQSALAMLAQSVLLAVYIWDMLVKGAIYSRALGIGRLQGNLLSLALSFGLFMLSSLLFLPPPPSP